MSMGVILGRFTQDTQMSFNRIEKHCNYIWIFQNLNGVSCGTIWINISPVIGNDNEIEYTIHITLVKPLKISIWEIPNIINWGKHFIYSFDRKKKEVKIMVRSNSCVNESKNSLYAQFEPKYFKFVECTFDNSCLCSRRCFTV